MPAGIGNTALGLDGRLLQNHTQAKKRKNIGCVLNMTEFVLIMTGFVLNMTGFLPTKLDLSEKLQDLF